MTVLAHLVLGLLLGAGSSVLPGPCGLAVIDAATRRRLGRALSTGAGAALGDVAYASLGILGLGPVLARHASVPPVLQAISGAVLVGYGVHHLSARYAIDTEGSPSACPRGRRDLGLGVAIGLATLLANPGAMLTWVVIVGSVLADASPVEGWTTVAGIGLGSCAWFSMMAVTTQRGRAVRGDLVKRVTRLVSCLLVTFGVVSLLRAAHGFLLV